MRFTKTKGGQIEIAEPHFHERCHILLNNEDIEPTLRESIMKIFNAFIEYQQDGSNWVLDKVLGVTVHIVQYNPIKGSSYLSPPAKLASKKAIVNVQNTDQKCFMWSVLAALYPVTNHPERVVNYVQHIEKLDFSGISFPGRRHSQIRKEKRHIHQCIWL